MPEKHKIAVIFGTRPDTIKLAPIIHALRQEGKYFNVLTIATAQHREMLDQVLEVFTIKPDYDLNIMTERQSLVEITDRTISALDDLLGKERPSMVVVQGDTTTTFAASLAAFYRRIPLAHVEAGLRTREKYAPFPEEINRRLTSALADLHFAPTATAKKALLRENIDPHTIFVTGNSVIDALRIAVKRERSIPFSLRPLLLERQKRIILVTMHRRENWGEAMTNACRAIRTLAHSYSDVSIVMPVHLNPVVRELVTPLLGDIPNVHLVEPLGYVEFIHMMARSYLIITDSGGVQEEGPALGKPVLVLRTVTERPEAIRFGTARLVGLNEETIVSAARKLLNDQAAYRRMASATNPYGDGRAAKRTVAVLKNYFGFARRPVQEFNPRVRRRGRKK